MKIAGEPGFDRHTSADWAADEWDDVGEVPAVEPLPRQSRLVKWTVWGVMGIVIAMILIAGWVGWWYLERVKPEGQVTEAVPFTVLAGDNVDTLATRLQQEGFVEDASVFTWYVERHGGLEIVPGYYQLRHNDHVGNVLGRLRTPPDQTFGKVTFPEGFTIQQMADRLAEAHTAAERGRVHRRRQLADRELRLQPAGRHLNRGAAVPRHVPGVERRQRGPGRRADGRR